MGMPRIENNPEIIAEAEAEAEALINAIRDSYRFILVIENADVNLVQSKYRDDIIRYENLMI